MLRSLTRRPCFINLLLLASLAPLPAGAGKLDQAGKEARHGSSDSTSSSSTSSSDEDSGEVTETEGALLVPFYVITAPWWAPHVLLESTRAPGSAERARFAPYPYARGYEGHLIEPQPQAPNTPRGLPVAGVIGSEGGIGLTDGILRFGVSARLFLPMRLELDSDWSLYREKDGDSIDRLWLGREHLSLRFAESSRVVFRSGLGPSHLCDAEGCVHGGDLTWGFEAFPAKPVVLSLEGAAGGIGKVPALGARARLGVLLGPMELNVGYQHRQIGSVGLGGPFVGLSAWF